MPKLSTEKTNLLTAEALFGILSLRTAPFLAPAEEHSTTRRDGNVEFFWWWGLWDICLSENEWRLLRNDISRLVTIFESKPRTIKRLLSMLRDPECPDRHIDF